jgi:hypothetical protein
MTSRQLKNPYGFFAPYIPMPKGRSFTARLEKPLGEGWLTGHIVYPICYAAC